METLRMWRVKRLMTIRDLATKAGVSTKTIVDIELERQTPRFETIRRISDALNVQPSEVAEFAQAMHERGKDAA